MVVKPNLFLAILALLFFVLAALAGGGIITGTHLGWLVPAGLASLTLAFILS